MSNQGDGNYSQKMTQIKLKEIYGDSMRLFSNAENFHKRNCSFANHAEFNFAGYLYSNTV